MNTGTEKEKDRMQRREMEEDGGELEIDPPRAPPLHISSR